MLASPRDQSKVSHWLWEKKKTDNIEFYNSYYFGLILYTVCKVLRHFIPQPRFHA